MRMLILPLFIMTASLTLSSCVSVSIYDEQFCSPIPEGLGAVCDNLLTKNQLILSPEEWEMKQAQWVANGESLEVTPSGTIGRLKASIEKLCSKTRCDYQTRQLIEGLNRIEGLGK
jgi:hypothetical protein